MEFSDTRKKLEFDISEQNPNVLIFSDLHFYKHRGSAIFVSIVEQYLKKILSLVEKDNINAIWFLGDWFHTKDKIGTEELVISSKFLNELKRMNVKILMIPGNHDLAFVNKVEYNSIQAFNIADNVYIVNKYDVWKYKNKIYHFFGYNISSEEEIKNCMQECPKGKYDSLPLFNKDDNNFAFGHLELNNVKMNDNYTITSTRTNITESLLSKMFKMTFLGHYHGATKNNNVIIVGSAYQQNFGEQSNNNYMFIYNCETDNIKLIVNDFSPKFKKIYLKDYDIKTEEDLNKIDVEKTFLRIILNKSVPSDLLIKLKEKLSEKNHLVEMVFDYEDTDELELGPEEKQDYLRQKLSIIDLNNTTNLKTFFGTYLDIFSSFPNGVSKEKLKDIINNVI